MGFCRFLMPSRSPIPPPSRLHFFPIHLAAISTSTPLRIILFPATAFHHPPPYPHNALGSMMMHHQTAVLCLLLSASLLCPVVAGAAQRVLAPALLQEVAPWDGPSQHNWRDAHIASWPSRLLLGFTGNELAPEAAAGVDEQLAATSTSGRQLKSALAAAKLGWGRGSLRLSPIAPTAAAHVLRRAAAFLDGGELGPAGGLEQAEVMLPVPVALPDGFMLESGTLQPNESGSGFAELFAKVPHKGSGVAAGAQRAGPDDTDARQQGGQEGDAVLESGKLDAAGSGAGDQKQPVPSAANTKDSSSSSADDDGSLSAIPSAAVIEAQRLKQAAAEKQAKEASVSPPASTASPPSDGGGGADAVSLIPTDPTAPRMVPYVGSSSSSIPYSAGGVIISGGVGGSSSFSGGLPHSDAGGARSASLASLRDRASRMESGEQQSSAAHQGLPPAALAGIVVGVVGGVGAGVALLLVLRARNARKAAAVAAAVATGRKARAPAAAAPAASRESDGESGDDDVEAAGAAAADAPAVDQARSRR